ncbi:MAG: hydroxyacid dehydrogenase [Deltaproteobacteria bacterium]|nr:hydroxyacid dehydrogenase [Deltaproteobacteria bacterium]
MSHDQLRVLVADEMAADAVSIMSNAGLKVDVNTGRTPEQLKEIIGQYHGLAVRSASKVTAAILESATHLKIVGRAGVGVDNIDVDAATKKGVLVINTPAGNGIAAGELALGYIFALARKLPQSTASMKAGQWDKKSFMGVEITGKTLGVVGFGNIGRMVGDRAVGLKMKVLAYDPHIAPGSGPPAGTEFVSLEDLISRSDFITLHMPLTPQTKGLFGRENLLKMKKSAYLINCARGGIVDEQALYEVMKDGHLAGAALDVFEQEPCGPLPVLQLPNVLSSPHTGASTKEAQVKVAIELAEVFVDYLLKGSVRNAVNKL